MLTLGSHELGAGDCAHMITPTRETWICTELRLSNGTAKPVSSLDMFGAAADAVEHNIGPCPHGTGLSYVLKYVLDGLCRMVTVLG